MTIEFIENAKIHHATKAKAEKLAGILAAEYPMLVIEASYNEDRSRVVGFIVAANEENIYTGEKVPELADLLEACEDLGIDPEEGVEEETRGGSIVPDEYRAKYREVSSNGQTCGDWLAEFLTLQCHNLDGFQVSDFAALLTNNEVDQSGAWAKLPESGQKGWVGRWRMNGRQTLEKTVARAGFIIGVNGERFEVPVDELAALRGKHAAYLAKLAKAEAKAQKET